MRNVLDDVVSMDQECVAAVYCTTVIDPDLTDPLILLLPVLIQNTITIKFDDFTDANVNKLTCFVLSKSSFRRYVSCGSVC